MTQKNFTVSFSGIPNRLRSALPHKPPRTYSCTVERMEDGRYKAEYSGYSQTACTEYLAKYFIMGFLRESNDPHSGNDSRWSMT